MMIIAPAQDIHMQRDARGLRPAAHAVLDHLRVQGADRGRPEAEIADEERPRRDVHHGAREGFVERGVGVPEAGDARSRAQRRVERRAERQEGVFGCVVVVDLKEGKGGEKRCVRLRGKQQQRIVGEKTYSSNLPCIVAAGSIRRASPGRAACDPRTPRPSISKYAARR